MKTTLVRACTKCCSKAAIIRVIMGIVFLQFMNSEHAEIKTHNAARSFMKYPMHLCRHS